MQQTDMYAYKPKIRNPQFSFRAIKQFAFVRHYAKEATIQETCYGRRHKVIVFFSGLLCPSKRLFLSMSLFTQRFQVTSK